MAPQARPRRSLATSSVRDNVSKSAGVASLTAVSSAWLACASKTSSAGVTCSGLMRANSGSAWAAGVASSSGFTGSRLDMQLVSWRV